MKHTGRALVVKSPWSYLIIDDNKTWEIRGSRTHLRGRIDIAESGTGTVIGTVDLVDCIGPLTREQFINSYRNHRVAMVDKDDMPYEKTYAWVLQNPVRFKKPISYKHPSGAVIWVKL